MTQNVAYLGKGTMGTWQVYVFQTSFMEHFGNVNWAKLLRSFVALFIFLSYYWNTY